MPFPTNLKDKIETRVEMINDNHNAKGLLVLSDVRILPCIFY